MVASRLLGITGLLSWTAAATECSADSQDLSSEDGVLLQSREIKAVAEPEYCIEAMRAAPSDMAQALSDVCSTSRTLLTQADFAKGTYQITQPGLYQLAEDISFAPTGAGEDMMPTDGSTEYPLDNGFWLGFFAAISIATDGVFLDLNGKTIEQSKEHHLRQRFFSVIELGSKPFQASTGPPQFASSAHPLIPARNVVIANGGLGKSSHMGVHGNGAEFLWLNNVNINNFETGGIQINGGKHIHVTNTVIGPSLQKDVPAATLSQANLLLRVVGLENPDWLAEEQFSKLKEARDALVHGSCSYDACNLFRSPEEDNGDILPDGSALYGMLFHTHGLPVHDFLSCSTAEESQQAAQFGPVTVENVTVRSLHLRTDEVVAAVVDGKKVLGPAGDVVQLWRLQDKNGRYQGTVLSDAQLRLGQKRLEAEASENTFEAFGSTHVPQSVVDWWVHSTPYGRSVGSGGAVNYVCDQDSMGHFNKGVVGIRMNGIRDASFKNVVVEDLVNTGQRSQAAACADKEGYKGNDVRGLTAIVSPDISFEEVEIKNLSAAGGMGLGLELRHGATSNDLGSVSMAGIAGRDADSSIEILQKAMLDSDNA